MFVATFSYISSLRFRCIELLLFLLCHFLFIIIIDYVSIDALA